ncbi:hypothetical protein HHK36_008519 [Tetracentron sinense]|uniref:Erythronate-4-phosphate dehydrogenase family protein n=1 Tax=Tetracentron sinense TaxID=13715 RepID=A0A834ZQB4_TETSI|nr:hypothetical protein HHK36_008519 [Tetracentron sinense]
MEFSYETVNKDEPADPDCKIIRHPAYQPCSKLSPWFDLRVFYVRISNCEFDDLTSEYLTLNHIPLSPDTLLEVNGVRSSIYSEGVSSLLRRDRVDKKSEEATFVSTDGIRMTGSVKFEVFDKEDLILSGVLEMSNGNGFIGESKKHCKRWIMNCESRMIAGTGFLKGKQYTGPELPSPTIEVYVAGCFSGTPIILTRTLQLSYRKKHTRKGMLDSIPEYDTTECQKDVPSRLALQEISFSVRDDMVVALLDWQIQSYPRWVRKILISEYCDYKPEYEEDYNNLYCRAEYIEGEGGELSWFNAGVRVGVGIGLGICLGIGLGAGLLVSTYQATTRNFKRQFV